MTVEQELQNFIRLSHRIQRLIRKMVELQEREQRLKDELEKAKSGAAEQEHRRRIAVLESEVKRLKKENRTLKEREQLIKNKLERLAVKLNEIE